MSLDIKNKMKQQTLRAENEQAALERDLNELLTRSLRMEADLLIAIEASKNN